LNEKEIKMTSLIKGDKKKAKVSSIDKLMQSISDLERQLERLEKHIPSMVSEIMSMREPYTKQMLEQRRTFILWLVEQYYCIPKNKKYKTLKHALLDLIDHANCLMIERFGHDMTKELEGLGLPKLKSSGDEFKGLSPYELKQRFEEDTGEEMPEGLEELMHDFIAGKEIDHEKINKFTENFNKTDTETTKPESKAAQKTARLKKDIYYGLARELHPDKTSDLEEQRKRTELMKKLNVAYEEGDMKVLLELLHIHGSQDAKDGLNKESLKSLEKALRQQQIDLRTKIQLKTATLPPIPGQWSRVIENLELWKKTKNQLEDELLDEIQRFKSFMSGLSKPGALEEFIYYTDEFMWDEYL
jgi:hypothetical protein